MQSVLIVLRRRMGYDSWSCVVVTLGNYAAMPPAPFVVLPRDGVVNCREELKNHKKQQESVMSLHSACFPGTLIVGAIRIARGSLDHDGGTGMIISTGRHMSREWCYA